MPKKSHLFSTGINQKSRLQISQYISNAEGWYHFVLFTGTVLNPGYKKEGKTYLIEAKHTERPNPDKLYLTRVSRLFNRDVNKLVACNVKETGMIALKQFSVYNPLFGSIL